MDGAAAKRVTRRAACRAQRSRDLDAARVPPVWAMSSHTLRSRSYGPRPLTWKSRNDPTWPDAVGVQETVMYRPPFTLSVRAPFF